ncbi:hypothetical protein CCYA_CCYA02G0772 [Cyanidiococcus yangmingshanensis]|nr:hypothetical protein CCYA_CCYA02G0772 [Cyanidiococcus yangmingshanensis]
MLHSLAYSSCNRESVAWINAVPVRRSIHIPDAFSSAPRVLCACKGPPSLRTQRGSFARRFPEIRCTGETERRIGPEPGQGKKSPSPSTFYQALTQAVSAVQTALQQGERLLEIEFPPLPSSILNSSTSSAYDVIDANTRLAFDFAKLLQEISLEKRPGTAPCQRIALIFPDMIERNRAASPKPAKNGSLSGYASSFGNNVGTDEARIRLAALRPGFEAGNLLQRLLQANIRGDGGGDRIDPVLSDDDIFIVLGASAQELVDVEKFVQRVEEADKAGNTRRPVILFNLQLDVSRGDLGLPAFPSRALHHRFLCRFLPVYYLRTRSYSRSMPRPPYVVNYQGAIFRVYPEPYQVLLETGNGRYRCVAEYAMRPTLHDAKQVLTRAVIPSGNEDENGSFGFLRKGFQTATWWERATADRSVSNKWRE